MPIQVDLDQNTDAWKEWRRWKIGASMAPVIMGVSPFQTKLQLWEQIVLGSEKAPSKAMIRGSQMEEKARAWVNEHYSDHGLRFRPACLQHDSLPWMIASLDGWICHLPGTDLEIKKAVEIKCPGTDAHMLALSGEVPHYYMPQLQHQMVVANLNEILYVSFDGENGVAIPVKRDDKYVREMLLPQEAAFYNSLLDFKAPEPCDKDVVAIDNPEASNAAEKYFELGAKIEELEKEMGNLRKFLIESANHNRAIIGKARLTKVMRKGNVDYGKIPELKGVNLDKYRNAPIESWRITAVS